MNAPDENQIETPSFYQEWRQGYVLTGAALTALGLNPDGSESAIGIVISHDCDIGADPEKDALVEVILGKLTPELGDCAQLKNPRILDLEIHCDPPAFCRLKAAEKRSVEKISIPDACIDKVRGLDDTNRRFLTRWLAGRYRRSAFPNSFEDRLNGKNFRKIEGAVRKQLPYIEEILFRVDDNGGAERPDGENHLLGIMIVIKSFGDQAQRMEAERAVREAAREIETLFTNAYFDKKTKEWDGIELDYCDATPVSALSYEMFLGHQPWRLEHLSSELGQKPSLAIVERPTPTPVVAVEPPVSAAVPTPKPTVIDRLTNWVRKMGK